MAAPRHFAAPALDGFAEVLRGHGGARAFRSGTGAASGCPNPCGDRVIRPPGVPVHRDGTVRGAFEAVL